VRLIHFTLQEYLQAHPELFDRPHAAMAETCLSYLNSRQVKALIYNPFSDFRGTPFLNYSSLYWGRHAKRDLSDCAKPLALNLFGDCSDRISTKILLVWYYPRCNSDRPFFSGLHCASLFGIDELVTCFIEVEGCDINGIDYIGSAPLVWAAKNGYEGVVRILLGRDNISPDRPDEYGETPLCWATSNGHEGVVEILLGRDDVNPDQPDKYGRTPLWCAAKGGHEEVVKILLGRDVNPNQPDKYGRTPLWCAAWNGHEGVVKLLLGRDEASPGKPDIYSQVPLLCAAANGHTGV